VIFVHAVFEAPDQAVAMLAALDERINDLAKEGWDPQGGVSTTVIPILNPLANRAEYFLMITQGVSREKPKPEIQEPKIPLSTSS